jgi:hypothetical protein
MLLQARYLLFVGATLIVATASVGAQSATIPERMAKGAVGSVTAGAPSGIGPSVATLLDSTDILVTGKLGAGHSYLSKDQTEIFTDFPLENARVLFQRTAATMDRPGSLSGLSVTQRGGTITVDGRAFTQKEGGLLPLQPGGEVLCLLKHVGDKYQIAGRYFGVFAIEDGRLRPLVTREDFAPDYRGRSFQEAVQSMLAVLQKSR